jgi:hypothetical protein
LDRDVKFMIYLLNTQMAKFHIKLLFSSASHPQTIGRTKEVNRNLLTLLNVLIKKEKKFGKLHPHYYSTVLLNFAELYVLASELCEPGNCTIRKQHIEATFC